MISKSDMLRSIREIIVSDDYTMPLYLGHILQTLPWYGLSAEAERKAARVLEKIRSDIEDERRISEEICIAVQERKYDSF